MEIVKCVSVDQGDEQGLVLGKEYIVTHRYTSAGINYICVEGLKTHFFASRFVEVKS